MMRQSLLLSVLLFWTGSSQAATSYPNLPAGLNLLYQYDGNGLPNNGLLAKGPANMTAGVGGFWGNTNATNPDEPSAPVDAPVVYDLLYPTGMAGGSGPSSYYLWSDASRTQMTEYYEAGWFRLLGANFEGPGSGQWKMLGYWAVGGQPGVDAGNQIYGVTVPVGSTVATAAGVVAEEWGLEIAAQGNVSWRIYHNPLSPTIRCGKWYRYEIRMALENPIAAANGILEVWLTNVSDGGEPVKIISSTNRTYRGPTNPAGFWQRSFNPVWGGGSFAPKTRNDHLQIARMAGWGRGFTPPTDTAPPGPPIGFQIR